MDNHCERLKVFSDLLKITQIFWALLTLRVWNVMFLLRSKLSLVVSHYQEENTWGLWDWCVRISYGRSLLGHNIHVDIRLWHPQGCVKGWRSGMWTTVSWFHFHWALSKCISVNWANLVNHYKIQTWHSCYWYYLSGHSYIQSGSNIKHTFFLLPFYLLPLPTFALNYLLLFSIW